MRNQIRNGIGPILSIRSETSKGLELSWNFTGITAPSFQYYHVFIFVTANLEEAQAFYQNYWLSLKVGQLFGVFYNMSTVDGRKGKISWHQKSGFNCLPKNIKQANLLQQLNESNLDELILATKKKRGLIAVNIFCDFQKYQKYKIINLKSLMENYIGKIRLNSRTEDKIIFNLISTNFQHSTINCNTGFNFIHYDHLQPIFTCQQILAFLRTLLVKCLNLTIETKQKFNILSCTNSSWFVSGGFEMEKKYFAIPKIHFCQYINLCQIKDTPSQQFELNISLNFTFFDERQIRDHKIVKIKPESEKNFLHSINHNVDMNKFPIYEFSKGIFLHSNIKKQQSFILFSKIKEKDMSKPFIRNFDQ